MSVLYAWAVLLAAFAVAWPLSRWVYGLFCRYMANTTGAAELRAWEARHCPYRSGGSAPEDSAGWGDGGGD